MAVGQKLCQVCGTDVASQKRIKDPQGLYYCHPCYAKRRQAASEASAATVPAPANDLFACADCKKLVPQKLITNDDGVFLCQACFAKRRAPVLAGQKPATAIVEYERNRPGNHNEPFAHSLAGGSVIALAVLAGTFIALSILNYFIFGATAKPLVLLAIAIASGVETFFVFILACMLIVSMLFAAKIMGGIEFGYLGAVLWKSIVAILCIFVASTILSLLHLPCFFGLGTTLLFYATIFVIVFKIEYTQAIVLALINMVVWFFGMIALIFVMRH